MLHTERQLTVITINFQTGKIICFKHQTENELEQTMSKYSCLITIHSISSLSCNQSACIIFKTLITVNNCRCSNNQCVRKYRVITVYQIAPQKYVISFLGIFIFLSPKHLRIPCYYYLYQERTRQTLGCSFHHHYNCLQDYHNSHIDDLVLLSSSCFSSSVSCCSLLCCTTQLSLSQSPLWNVLLSFLF